MRETYTGDGGSRLRGWLIGHAAVFYSLIGTCLLQGIDPKRYLVEIAGRLDEPVSRLTPHAVREAWEAAQGQDEFAP